MDRYVCDFVRVSVENPFSGVGVVWPGLKFALGVTCCCCEIVGMWASVGSLFTYLNYFAYWGSSLPARCSFFTTRIECIHFYIEHCLFSFSFSLLFVWSYTTIKLLR